MAEGTKHKDIVVRIYPEQIRGTDPEAKERGIKSPNDWRNADVVIPHESYTVYVGDQQYNMHHGPIVPDWSQGWSVRNNSNGQTMYEGKGEPPWWVAQSLRDGLTLEGILVLRDNQMHN